MLITYDYYVNGNLTNAYSIRFGDFRAVPIGDFGLRRSDTLAELVAEGTSLPTTGTGQYAYNLTEPVGGLTYDYWITIERIASDPTPLVVYRTQTATTELPSDDAPIIAYTSLTEIERLYSQTGVNLRLDDLDQVERTNFINSIIAEATEMINGWTINYYTPSALTTSQWVRRRATIIACYLLSERRGNPTQFAHHMQRVVDELEKLMTKFPKFQIPGADGNPIPVRAADVPSIVTPIIDDRQRIQKARVVRENSTKPYAGQPFYDPPYTTNLT